MKIKCIQCKKTSNKKEWKISYEECELCTSHAIYTCPKCGDSDEYMFENIQREYSILNQHSNIPLSNFKSLKKAKEQLKQIALNSEKEGFIVNCIDDKQYKINDILIYIK